MADADADRRDKVMSACNECRKKKTKCDGELPCARCASRPGLDCVYDPHLKQTKESMQAEHSRVRAEWQTMNAVLKLLKVHEQPQIILDQLRSGQTLEMIVRAGSGQTPAKKSCLSSSAFPESSFEPTASSFELDRSATTTVKSLSPTKSTLSSTRDIEGAEDQRSDSTRFYLSNPHLIPKAEHKGSGDFPSAGWTALTSNGNLVDHLLALYFSWEYPTFATLSREHFIQDFRSGSTRFCSSLLVNAILALGAKSSEAVEARKDPSDPHTAGDHFFEEAKRLLGHEEVPTLTTIQALGLMSLRQASCGKDASSFFYARQALRMALDIDLHRQHPTSRVQSPSEISTAECEVRIATLWGCFNLEQAWSLCIERPSQVMSADIEIPKPTEIEEIENEHWRPYTDAITFSSEYRQPSNIRSVYRCFSELSEVINRSTHRMYLLPQQLESQKLLSSYHELLEWYDALPDQLRLGRNSTPTVLFTHMYYHFATLILFRPFKNLSISGSNTSPSKICLEAAQNLFVLIKSYKDLYTLRRVPSFVPYMVLTANLAYLVDIAFSNIETTESAHELVPLSYLEEMCSTHGFSRRALDIVDYFSQLWGIKTQDNGAVRLIRKKLHGMQRQNHAANNVSRSDTFFLPAANSSTNRRPHGFQVGDLSTSGTIMSLFPQQGTQLNDYDHLYSQAVEME